MFELTRKGSIEYSADAPNSLNSPKLLYRLKPIGDCGDKALSNRLNTYSFISYIQNRKSKMVKTKII